MISSMETFHISYMHDGWRWELDQSGCLSVRSVRAHLDHSLLPSSDKIIRWNKHMPIKVNVF